jgi:hypothetical protein
MTIMVGWNNFKEDDQIVYYDQVIWMEYMNLLKEKFEKNTWKSPISCPTYNFPISLKTISKILKKLWSNHI